MVSLRAFVEYSMSFVVVIVVDAEQQQRDAVLVEVRLRRGDHGESVAGHKPVPESGA